jgi:hypothetical protein
MGLRSFISRSYRSFDKKVFKGRLPGGAEKPSPVQQAQAQATQRQDQAQRRETTKATVRALATPVAQRTPEQLARTRKVGAFIGGAVVTAVPVTAGARIAGAIGTRITSTAIKRGVSARAVSMTGTTVKGGALGYGTYETGRGVSRIARGEATAFEAGSTFGLGAVLAKPVVGVARAGARYVRAPKISRVQPKELAPTLTVVQEKAKIKTQDITATIFGGRFIQPIKGKKPRVERFGGIVAGRFESDVGRGIIVTKDKTFTPFITASARPYGRRFKGITYGFAGVPRRTINWGRNIFSGRRRKPFVTQEIYEIGDISVARVKGVEGEGAIITQKLPRFKTQPPTFGGEIPKSKTVTKAEQTFQAEVLAPAGAAIKTFRETTAKRISREGAKRIRQRATTEIKTRGKTVAQKVMSATPTLATIRAVTGSTLKERQRFDLTQTQAIGRTTGVTVSGYTAPATRTMTEVPISPFPFVRPPRVPFAFGWGILPFGGGGRGYNWNKRIKGKEVGGRFMRSFTANVLGIKAPRKRKYKSKYTGFELRN